MPKLPVIEAKEAERILLKLGFILIRTKGSHKIFKKDSERIVIPFHSGKPLHPKIIKGIIDLESSTNTLI